jgi:hypothetical protein
MARFTSYFVAVALLAAPAAAPAQDSSPAQPERARVEVGGGGGVLFSGGTMPYTEATIDARVGVALGPNWSIESLVLVTPSTSADIGGFYRAQALWRFGGGAVQPFLAFGGAGEFSRHSWPEYRYNDYYTGEPQVIPAGSDAYLGPPWYPTVSLGFEKILASHLAMRAELTVAFGVNDYGLAAAVLPAVSLSIPIGRYGRATR